MYNTCIPSIGLQNLPSHFTVQDLQSVFGQYSPKVVRIVGTRLVKVAVARAEEVSVVSKLLQEITFANQSVSIHTSKLPNSTYCVEVSNIHSSTDTDSARDRIEVLLKSFQLEHHPSLKYLVGASNGVPSSVLVRLGEIGGAKVTELNSFIKEVRLRLRQGSDQ